MRNAIKRPRAPRGISPVFRGAWMPLLALGAASCTTLPEAPSTPVAEALSTSSTALSAEPAPDSYGNSAPSEELNYVPQLGFMDGTNCESWPHTVQLFLADTASGGDPISAALLRMTPRSPTRTALNAAYQALLSKTVSGTTQIGSKRGLIVRTLPSPGPTGDHLVAYNPDEGAGYVVDAQYLCAQEDEEQGLCSWKMNTVDKTLVPILYRTKPRTSVPTVELVAPWIRFPSYVRADLNLIVVADKLIGGDELQYGEVLSDRPGTINVDVIPWMDSSNWRTQVLPTTYTDGLMAAFVGESGGIKSVAVTSNRVDLINISNTASPWLFKITIPPSEALPLRQADWSFLTDVKAPDGGFFTTTYVTRSYEGKLTFQDLPYARTHAGVGGTNIFYAGARNQDLQLFAPGAPAPTVMINRDDMVAYVNTTLLPALDAKKVDFAPYPQTKVTNSVPIGVGSPWIADYPICAPVPINNFRIGCEINTTPNKVTAFMGDFLGYHPFSPAFGTNGTVHIDPVDLAATLEQGLRSMGERAEPPIAGTVLDVQNPTAALAAANLFSRGAFFNQMFAQADNASLRYGVPDPSWSAVAAQTSRATLLSILTPANQTDAQITKVFGVDPARMKVASGWDAYLTSPMAHGPQPLNALGIPYGRVSEPWMPAPISGTPTKAWSLLETQLRWNDMASLVLDINAVAETQRTDRSIEEVGAKLDDAIDHIAGYMDTVTTVANQVSNSAGLTVDGEAKAVAKLNTTLDQLTKNQTDLETQIRKIWGCTGMPDLSLCISNMNAALNEVKAQCVAAKSSNFFDSLISLAVQFVPYVSTAATFLNKAGLFDAVGLSYASLKSDIDGISKALTTIDDARKAVEGGYSAMQSALDASDRIAGLVSAGVPDCEGTDKQAQVNVQLNQMAATNSLMQLLGSNIQMLGGIIEGIEANVSNLVVTQRVFGDLSTQGTATAQRLRALKGDNVIASMSQRRDFIRASCRADVAAERAFQADLFHVSSMLNTTIGTGSVPATLVIPPDPNYLVGGNTKGENLGFLVSIWEPERFGRRLAKDGTMPDNFMALARQRFQLAMKELTDTSPESPPARFLVRKRIGGLALQRFRTTGQVDFGVTLDDLVTGGNVEPTDTTAISVLTKTGSSISLDGPIVFDVQYLACTGTGSDPCAAGKVQTLPTAPYIARTAGALVPSGDRSGAFVTSTVPLSTNGHYVQTYLVPTQLPQRAWQLGGATLPLTSDQQIASTFFNGLATVDPTALQWNAQDGIPLLGHWTLAKDSTSANAVLDGTTLVAPLNAPALTAIDVIFVVGAQPSSAPPKVPTYFEATTPNAPPPRRPNPNGQASNPRAPLP